MGSGFYSEGKAKVIGKAWGSSEADSNSTTKRTSDVHNSEVLKAAQRLFAMRYAIETLLGGLCFVVSHTSKDAYNPSQKT